MLTTLETQIINSLNEVRAKNDLPPFVLYENISSADLVEFVDAEGVTWNVAHGQKQWLRNPEGAAVINQVANTQAAVPASWLPGDALFVPTHNANPTSITRIPVYDSGIVYAMVDDGSGLREVPVQWNAEGVRNLTREAA